ncbi:uncharacterized protein LOC108347665 isoform X4 [Vigna angularis]|uniref:uncharacterized protein LOC108347665 isoform X4 n=1 Tax=Phaseolus angularis TaxID=3914 RepID=UPI0022B549E0|nr:uncharacterized protein LOC108347665 isoform X4 [Vigna angularis]
MVKVRVSNKEESPVMDNGGYSGSQLVHHFRSVLDAVKTGDRGSYDELVSYLHLKRNLSPDEVAILVTTLKALSGAVSYIDSDHHESLLFAVSKMSLWNYGTEVMDALLELITSLAATNGKYIDWCLEMLVKHFVPPFNIYDSLDNENGINRKNKVLSRVHAALKEIADLVPLAPLRLCPIVVQNMPSVFSYDREIVPYVENMLKLESGAIGETVGSTVLPALVDRLLELDVEIGWDGILQEDTKGIFDMELEDIIKFVEEDENFDSMPQSELLNRKNFQDKKVVEKLDNLIVLALLHLESCQSSGRLGEKTVLNAYKSKFTQFVMFYACALDPEGCGVKFAMVLADMFGSDVNPPITRMSAVAYLASYLSRAKFLSAALVTTIVQSLVDQCYAYCKLRDSGMNPRAHQVFYSGCQVCLPTVVVEFLRQAKAAKLFMASESFVFNDMLESDLSKAFGGMDRLDMFFPFDPCLLKKSESYIRPHFVRWSKVRTTYDDDDDNVSEVSESGSEVTDDDFVDTNTKDMIDDDMMVTVEDLDFNPNLNKMSITPKNSLKHLRMPARIRPSTSPESL